MQANGTWTWEAFEDICKLGLMDKMRFMNVEPDENHKLLNKLAQPYENEYFEILGIDDVKKLYTNLYVATRFWAGPLALIVRPQAGISPLIL